MEFLDELESKPRFVFQSKNLAQPHHDALQPSSSSFSSFLKPSLFISLALSLLFFILAFFYFNDEPLKSLLLWLSLSLLIGPFAPPSITAGDIRVGVGPPLRESPEIYTETNEKPSRKSSKSLKKTSEESIRFDGFSEKPRSVNGSRADLTEDKLNGLKEWLIDEKSEEGSEWSEADEELLKKLMGKHPVGKPGRWEAIAEGFKGKHKVETVIAMAKEMGDRKGSDRDSYQKFLKHRKPVDNRVVDEENAVNGMINENVEEEKGGGWTPAEDLALLNALKAFPKDVPMRWEKIAVSVPGKTKPACVKRTAELKKGFRSSKASSAQPS